MVFLYSMFTFRPQYQRSHSVHAEDPHSFQVHVSTGRCVSERKCVYPCVCGCGVCCVCMVCVWCGWDVGVCMCVGGCECVGPICGVRVGVYVVEDLKLTFYPLVRMIGLGFCKGCWRPILLWPSTDSIIQKSQANFIFRKPHIVAISP